MPSRQLPRGLQRETNGEFYKRGKHPSGKEEVNAPPGNANEIGRRRSPIGEFTLSSFPERYSHVLQEIRSRQIPLISFAILAIALVIADFLI